MLTMPTFAANLTFLWSELPFLERFEAAAEAGFAHVEYMFPYGHPPGEIRARLAHAGLRQVLFNLPAGDWDAGDRGIAADPARVEEFRAGVQQALGYAEALEVPQLNCLAGLRVAGLSEAQQLATLVGNLSFAARRAAAVGVRLLLEPVNSFDVPRFLVSRTDQALRVLDRVGEDRVGLQFDVYHVARMEGEVASRLRDLLDRVGHVQIADCPGRHQPGTGELDFAALFAVLDAGGYRGAVGLEYIPTPDTASSLAWLENYRLRQAEG
jgi:hydroxypyruvate isomerase